MKTLEIKITFLEEILGSLPSNESIYRDFISGKAPDAQTVTEEIEDMGADAVAEKGMTVFRRDEDGDPFLYDYQVKGFFKDACRMLLEIPGTESSKLSTYTLGKKIDGLIFPNPRKIKLVMPEGAEVGYCERPLRAQTMRGDRVALACSECCPAGTTCTFEITTLADFSTPKTKKKKVKAKDADGNEVETTVEEAANNGIDYVKLIKEWLDYGRYRGIGQWRNSGAGAFEWELIAEY